MVRAVGHREGCGNVLIGQTVEVGWAVPVGGTDPSRWMTHAPPNGLGHDELGPLLGHPVRLSSARHAIRQPANRLAERRATADTAPLRTVEPGVMHTAVTLLAGHLKCVTILSYHRNQFARQALLSVVRLREPDRVRRVAVAVHGLPEVVVVTVDRVLQTVIADAFVDVLGGGVVVYL